MSTIKCEMNEWGSLSFDHENGSVSLHRGDDARWYLSWNKPDGIVQHHVARYDDYLEGVKEFHALSANMTKGELPNPFVKTLPDEANGEFVYASH